MLLVGSLSQEPVTSPERTGKEDPAKKTQEGQTSKVRCSTQTYNQHWETKADATGGLSQGQDHRRLHLYLIHISEPTRQDAI